MNIVKSRGGMAAILASLVLASATAFAQAPGGGPPGGGGGFGGGAGGPGGGMGGRGGGPATKEQIMQRQGLTDAALKLTDAQKAALEKLAEKLAADQTALQAKYPPAQGGGAPNPEAQAARTKLTEAFTADVNKVLNDEQKKTWAARPQRGGGGPGGPGGAGGPGGGGGFGGGAGGPPGGGGGGPRGPGGAGGPPGGGPGAGGPPR